MKAGGEDQGTGTTDLAEPRLDATLVLSRLAANPCALRARVYGLMAEAFLAPREDFSPPAILAALSTATELLLGTMLRDLFQKAIALAERTPLLTLRSQHQGLFVGPGKLGAPPYESVYRGDGLMMGEASTDIIRLLNTMGLEVSDECRLPPDHISVELSLASQLSTGGSSEQRALEQLLTTHLSSWLPSFAHRIEHYSPHSFYASLATLCEHIINLDLASLRAESQ